MPLRRGSRKTLWRKPLEFIVERVENAAMLTAQIGQTAAAGHPGRFRCLAGILLWHRAEAVP